MLSAEEHSRLIQNSLIDRLFADFVFPSMVTNADHRIVWVNAAFNSAYGYQREEVIGLPVKLIYDPELSADTIKPAARQLLQLRKPWCGPYRNRRANGEVFTAYYVAVPLSSLAELPVTGVFCVSGPENESEALRESVLSHVVNRCFALAASGGATTSQGNVRTLSTKGQRQREIHRLSLLGYSSKEIASVMQISPSTVNVVRWKLAKAANGDGTNGKAMGKTKKD